MRDHFGHQYRFERTDRTGRFIPLHTEKDPWWVFIAGGIAMGFVLAVLLFLGN